MNKKKGQISLGSAPVVVMVVGLVFLVMATMAFIGEKYGNSIDTDNVAGTVINEAGHINRTGYTLAQSGKENFDNVVLTAWNVTSGQTILSGNYTTSAAYLVTNATSTEWNAVKFNYTYTYTAESSASNVTGDLQTEIGNNTSVAGMVLTISMIGIVLSILVGVFFGVSRRTSRV